MVIKVPFALKELLIKLEETTFREQRREQSLEQVFRKPYFQMDLRVLSWNMRGTTLEQTAKTLFHALSPRGTR